MTVQRIEMILDMHAKKVQSEFQRLREELAQAKEDLRKEIKLNAGAPAAQAPPQQWQQPAQPQWQPPQQQWQAQQPSFQGQFGAAPAPQWAQAGQGHQYPGHQQAPPPQRAGENAPSTKPIDRNGVAPSDVSIEKFFYVGGKR